MNTPRRPMPTPIWSMRVRALCTQSAEGHGVAGESAGDVGDIIAHTASAFRNSAGALRRPIAVRSKALKSP